MNSVYVFGPIYIHGDDYLDFYKQVNMLCAKYFDKVVGTYPDFWDTDESPQEFYARTYDVITKLDLFIGEVTSPSWGVGMEFQMAQEHNIPCIALCREGNKPSSMIMGIPCLRQIIYYSDIHDALAKIERSLRSKRQ